MAATRSAVAAATTRAATGATTSRGSVGRDGDSSDKIFFDSVGDRSFTFGGGSSSRVAGNISRFGRRRLLKMWDVRDGRAITKEGFQVTEEVGKESFDGGRGGTVARVARRDAKLAKEFKNVGMAIVGG